MQRWVPGMLVNDLTDEVYKPTDKEGRQFAAKVELLLRLANHRAKLTVANARAEQPMRVKKNVD